MKRGIQFLLFLAILLTMVTPCFSDGAVDFYNRGYAKMAIGLLQGAIADFSKAIELNPKIAWVYHARGCLRYDARDFTNALFDFRKELELDATNDYARFRVWLTRTRQGEAEAATKELQEHLSGRTTGQPDDWPAKIGHLLAGQLAEPVFLAAAKNADPKKESGQLCEAYFYAGSKRLFAGDQATAMDYFQKSIATDRKDFIEYASAAAELKFLKGQK